jgi:hypothetical protein
MGADSCPANAQAESQTNKLNLVKRQLYGRGKLDLLQARLIAGRAMIFIETESESQSCSD